MKSSTKRNKRIGVVFALAFALALVAALPVFASANETRDVDDLGDANDAAMTATATDHGATVNGPIGNYLQFEGEKNFVYTYTGQPQAPSACPKDAYKNENFRFADGDYTLTYRDTRANTDIDGMPSAVGEYEVIATGTGTNEGGVASGLYGAISQSFSIVEATTGGGGSTGSSSYLSVNIEGKKSFEYTGQPVQLEGLRVVFWDGENSTRTELTAGQYTITYKSVEKGTESAEPPSAVGTYRVIATGKANTPYGGWKSQEGDGAPTFTIYSANSFSSTKCVVDADPSLYDYTGQPITPTVTVWWNGEALVEGTDYTISYEKKVNGGASVEPLSGPPTEVGKYNVKATAKGKYDGSKTDEFEIAVANSLANPACEASMERQHYAYTGKEIKPNVAVTFNGVALVEGRDYTIAYEERVKNTMDQWVSCAAPIEIGSYRVVVKAAEGGAYSGRMNSEDNSQLEFSIEEDSNNNPNLWTANFADRDFSSTDRPVVSLTGKSVEPPAVIVTDPTGTALQEGKNYRLVVLNKNNERVDACTAEGEYNIKLIALNTGDEHYDEKEFRQLPFLVSKPEHDLTKATVTMPDTFDYAGGAEIKDTIAKSITVTMSDGKTLVLNQDFAVGYNRKTGTLGVHTATISGKSSTDQRSYDADGQRGQKEQQGQQGQQSNQVRYYGTVRLPYGVWNETAPAANKRVDLETGVSVTGSVIADKSTFEGEQWVTLAASKPTGTALTAAAQTAQTQATAAGALDVQVFDAKLDQVTSTGVADNSEGLTENLGDLTLSFPMGEKYNGMTATVTQIHDGKAMEPKTVTISGGQVPVSTDRLSEFVISVSETKATKATTAKTGDAFPMQAVAVIAIIAVIAAGALVFARRSSRR